MATSCKNLLLGIYLNENFYNKAVGVQYIKVNGYYATINEGTYALIDTGTTGLYFNDDIFLKSYQLLTTDGMCYYYEQDFFCPCYPSAE